MLQKKVDSLLDWVWLQQCVGTSLLLSCFVDVVCGDYTRTAKTGVGVLQEHVGLPSFSG